MTDQSIQDSLISIPYGEDFSDIRESVRAICKEFPGSYWREQEAQHKHALEFTQAMTDAGYLSAMIPEEFGGSGLPLRAGGVIAEEVAAAGCSSANLRAQAYMMKILVKHGTDEQRRTYLPDIASGKLRFQSGPACQFQRPALRCSGHGTGEVFVQGVLVTRHGAANRLYDDAGLGYGVDSHGAAAAAHAHGHLFANDSHAFLTRLQVFSHKGVGSFKRQAARKLQGALQHGHTAFLGERGFTRLHLSE